MRAVRLDGRATSSVRRARAVHAPREMGVPFGSAKPHRLDCTFLARVHMCKLRSLRLGVRTPPLVRRARAECARCKMREKWQPAHKRGGVPPARRPPKFAPNRDSARARRRNAKSDSWRGQTSSRSLLHAHGTAQCAPIAKGRTHCGTDARSNRKTRVFARSRRRNAKFEICNGDTLARVRAHHGVQHRSDRAPTPARAPRRANWGTIQISHFYAASARKMKFAMATRWRASTRVTARSTSAIAPQCSPERRSAMQFRGVIFHTRAP